MAIRVIGRATKIAVLLTGMFFTWLYARSGLRRLVWAVARHGQPYESLPNEAIVREAFEAMGPTFIKLGQVVASSPGLFPVRYSEEFAKCLDRVPPFDLLTLKATIAQGLGAPVEQVFQHFDEAPLGSASVAQVHAATLADGRHVVVKVQRPGIERVVDADIWWMRRGAVLLEKLFLGARLANLTGVIDDFDRTMHEEIDFEREAANLREFNAIMAEHGITDVKAPAPVDDLVTRKVLVMERFEGFKADDVEGLQAAGIDAEAAIRKGLRAWLLTVMLHGFFHGDAHAGNLMVLRDGATVGFLDFGIIGRFTLTQRSQVMRYILSFNANDFENLANVMIEMGSVTEEIDKAALVAELERLYSPLLDMAVADIRYEELAPELTRATYAYGIMLPSEFLLILKQLLFFDRYAKLAAPKLNIFNDFGLIDFLFTPAAQKAGLDFNELMPLLQRIQQRQATLQKAAS